MKSDRTRRGGALVAALTTLLVVMLVAGVIVRSRVSAHRQARQSQHELQAQWLAESAIERARAQLAHSRDYSGETWRPEIQAASGAGGLARLSAAVEIRALPIENASQTRRVIAIATYPNDEWRRVSVRREYNITLSPGTATGAPREENP
jgi:type II secretory pathway component PulK